MIPTIETICEDLKAGKVSVQQAIAWLYQHANGSANERREALAAMAMQAMLPLYTDNGKFRDSATIRLTVKFAYEVADEMLAGATVGGGGAK